MKTLITNAFLLDMAGDYANIKQKDILIQDNTIKKIDENINEPIDEIIDANKMLVMPGLINTHTHLAMGIFRGHKTDKKLMDWLEKAIFPVEEKLKPEDIYWNSYFSCLEMIKSGTTTCNDMYFGMNKTIEAIEDTGLRAIVAWCIKDDSIKNKVQKTREYAQKYNTNQNSKIKIWVSADAPHTCNPETIKLCVNLAKELNTGIHIHLSETLDEESKIKIQYHKRSTEYLNDLNVFDVPVVLAHGIYLSDSDIAILKNIKGGISHNPISNDRISTDTCNVEKLRNNGINIGLGTDGINTTATMDMFEEMKASAYLQRNQNEFQDENLAYEILKMATIDGAKVLGMENEIGSIEIGKKADLIFIDKGEFVSLTPNEICSNLVYSSSGADVKSVMIDGKMIMHNKQMLNLNEKYAKNQVKKVIKKLL